MSDDIDPTVSESTDTQSLTFRITEQLAAKINEASTTTGLNRSAMLRLAVDRGIDRLLEQLELSVTTNTGAESHE